VLAQVHPVSPGNAKGDLAHLLRAGPAGTALFVAGDGPGVPSHARAPHTRSSVVRCSHAWVRRKPLPCVISPRGWTGGHLPRETAIGESCRVVRARGSGGGGPAALTPRAGLTIDLFWSLASQLRRSPGLRPPAQARIGGTWWCATGGFSHDSVSLCVDGSGGETNGRPLSPSRTVVTLWCLPRAAPPRSVCVRDIHWQHRGARLRTPLARRLFSAHRLPRLFQRPHF